MAQKNSITEVFGEGLWFDPIAQYMHLADLDERGDDARQFDSIEHGEIKVDLRPNCPEGNLQTTIPNIEVYSRFPNGGSLTLTWEEARKLCAAIWQVTNVAEFG